MSSYEISPRHDERFVTRASPVEDELFRCIQQKKSASLGPSQATLQMAKLVQTDIDTWPYPRYFRGNYNSADPIVWDREAGSRKIEPYLPSTVPPLSPFIPSVTQGMYCFQPPCSTIFPCNPKVLGGRSMPDACVNISP